MTQENYLKLTQKSKPENDGNNLWFIYKQNCRESYKTCFPYPWCENVSKSTTPGQTEESSTRASIGIPKEKYTSPERQQKIVLWTQIVLIILISKARLTNKKLGWNEWWCT